MLDIMGYGFDYEFDVDNNEPIDIMLHIVLFQRLQKIKECYFLKDIINLKRNLKDVL